MSLRKKTWLVVGSALIGLLLTLLIVSSGVLLKGFKELEDQTIKQNVARVVNILTEEFYDLYQEVGDYAFWDDIYEGMIYPKEASISSFFPISTFIELHLNLVVILNREGRVVFGKIYQSPQISPLSPTYQTFFDKNQIFNYNSTKSNNLVGFLLLSGQLIMVVSRPILDSQGQGSSRGTLIMGSFLGEERIQHLTRMTDLALSIQLIDNKKLPSDFAEAHKLFSTQASVVQILDNDNIAGYIPLKDFSQRRVALLRVKMPREIYQQGLVSLRYLSGVVLVLALGFAWFILWSFEHLVLARLAVLSREVMHIQESSQWLTVTVEEGNDELTHLSIAINDRLKALQASHRRVHESETSLAEAQRIAQLGNWKWEMATGRLTGSDEIYRILGFPPQSVELSYEIFISQIHLEDLEMVTKTLQKAIHEDYHYSMEYRMVMPKERFIHAQGEVLRNHEGKVTHIIGTLQDITERKETQAETRRLLEENRSLIRRSMAIQEAERRYLARELHDEFGQSITAIQANAAAIRELTQQGNIPAGLAKINIIANAILVVSTHIYDVVHSLMQQLRPNGLDELGLVEILQSTVKAWQTRYPETQYVLTTTGAVDDLGETININVYRVVQECLTNVAKYAKASQVAIELSSDGEAVVLCVQDNGEGLLFNPDRRGLGLIGMRERAQALGGQLLVKSSIGEGVKIVFTIPRKLAHDSSLTS